MDLRRDFPDAIKRDERIRANTQCRICGSNDTLQIAHIYSSSQNPSWKRQGSDPNKWSDDKYVMSSENALILCKYHHDRIDSMQGLKLCTVSYLESLKSDVSHCTALIEDKSGKLKRCGNYNSRGKDTFTSNPYRCSKHPNGGAEEKLPVRTFPKPPPVKDSTDNVRYTCVIC